MNQDFISKHTRFAKGADDIGYGLRPDDPREKQAKNADKANTWTDISFEQYSAFVKPYTLERTAKETGVSAEWLKSLSCHSRANSTRTQATMISITHYMDRDGQPLAAVSPRRYFCNQCHVPQTDVLPLVGNSFETIDKILQDNANAAQKP